MPDGLMTVRCECDDYACRRTVTAPASTLELLVTWPCSDDGGRYLIADGCMGLPAEARIVEVHPGWQFRVYKIVEESREHAG